MPTTQVTYSDPTITRSATTAVITFDIHSGDHVAWQSFVIARQEDGTVNFATRFDGPVSIPAPILPVLLAELDRLAAADEPTPFEPVAAIRHVAVRHVPGIAEGNAA